jgi:hypothetical protein
MFVFCKIFHTEKQRNRETEKFKADSSKKMRIFIAKLFSKR